MSGMKTELILSFFLLCQPAPAAPKNGKIIIISFFLSPHSHFFFIFHEDCQRRCDFRCQNISKTDRKLWDKPSLIYICLTCRNDALGTFDIVKGLERLKKDALASYDQLTIGVEREKLLLKKVPLDASAHEGFSYQRQDVIANAIVLQYTVSTKVALQSTGNGDLRCPQKWLFRARAMATYGVHKSGSSEHGQWRLTVSTKVALQSTGNGDCLFNSFSTGLVGDESRAVELRYRCCIEMVTNKSRLLRPKLFRALEPITPNYDTDCLNCARKR